MRRGWREGGRGTWEADRDREPYYRSGRTKVGRRATLDGELGAPRMGEVEEWYVGQKSAVFLVLYTQHGRVWDGEGTGWDGVGITNSGIALCAMKAPGSRSRSSEGPTPREHVACPAMSPVHCCIHALGEGGMCR